MFVIGSDKNRRASELWCTHTKRAHVILNAATFARPEQTKQSTTSNNGKLCPLWGTISYDDYDDHDDDYDDSHEDYDHYYDTDDYDDDDDDYYDVHDTYDDSDPYDDCNDHDGNDSDDDADYDEYDEYVRMHENIQNKRLQY